MSKKNPNLTNCASTVTCWIDYRLLLRTNRGRWWRGRQTSKGATTRGIQRRTVPRRPIRWRVFRHWTTTTFFRTVFCAAIVGSEGTGSGMPGMGGDGSTVGCPVPRWPIRRGKRSNPSGIRVEVGGPGWGWCTRHAYYQLDEINK